MAIKNKLIVTALLMSFLIMGMVQTAHAYTFYIDEFSVTKNGYLLFDDKFNDGNPPPIGGPNLYPGSTGTLSYSVFGTMGPENSGNPGKLTLDSSGGLIDFNPPGLSFLEQRAVLLTNIDQNDLTLGLKSDDTFSVTGVFDLIIPSVPLSGYGVRFTDGIIPGNTSPNDVAYVLVERITSGDVEIRFLHFDFNGNTITLLGQTTLDPSHTTISLKLERGSTSSDTVTAFYAYNGESFTQLPGTMDIFNDENFTRAQFVAFEPAPVPEPSTLLLLGSGLIGLAGYGRRKLFKK